MKLRKAKRFNTIESYASCICIMATCTCSCSCENSSSRANAKHSDFDGEYAFDDYNSQNRQR